MGLFSRRPTAAAPIEERALTRASLPASMLPEGREGEQIGPDQALRLADVWACVKVLADTAATLPLVAYRRRPDGRERFAGRLADLLTQPAPGVTTADLTGRVMVDLLLHGNSFLGKFRDARGTVVQLAPLPPRGVTVELRAGQPHYTLLRADGVSEHGPEDVLHIKALSADGLVGMSPIRQAAQAIGLSSALAEHGAAFARNAGRPGGILRISNAPATTFAGAAGQTAADAMKATFEAAFQGGQSGRVLVAAADALDYTQLGLSLVDAQYIEQRQLSTAEIARVFGVPPFMIGTKSGDSLTYATTESQGQAFLTYGLRPWLARIEQAITGDADLSPRGVYCEFLVDALLRADAATRAAVFTQALNPITGWLDRSDVRRMENLPPEPGRPTPTPSENTP